MSALTDYSLASLEAQIEQWGGSPRVARKLLRQFYFTGGNPDLPSDALSLGKRVLSQFDSGTLKLRSSRIVTKNVAQDGTVKFLLGFDAGGTAETVLMSSPKPTRAGGCVSSQIGCAMGCDFCASTKGGLERNLTAGEICEQYVQLLNECRVQNRRLATLVFMGMGEPMHNLDNVVEAIRVISSPVGGLGHGQISVSTVGIVPGIEKLQSLDLGVNLALSLHAPDDETRSKIVPMNKRYPVADIMRAATEYAEQSKTILMIEYCMLDQINDSEDHARMLVDLVKPYRLHVNLIPFNPIGTSLRGHEYRKPTKERLGRFFDILREAEIATVVRVTRGDDVAAACGQLRQRSLEVLGSESR